LGSGLTAVDALLELEARGWRGKATITSRRGLLPQPHDAVQAHLHTEAPKHGRLSVMLNAFRARAASAPWGRLMDELRPHGQLLWTRMTAEEKRRFLRHLRPWWDVHRHRIAPRVATRLARLRVDGRLDIVAGKLLSAARDGEAMTVTLRPRGARETQTLTAPWLVNCTGPEMDITRAGDPLLTQLFGAGVARPDELKFGVQVDATLRVHDAFGRMQSRLFAIGPVTRGAFWEVIAVPDIRIQAMQLADTLSALDTLRAAEVRAGFESDVPGAELRV
jgi:uncharacterized NAD(P)/FAD-binding protein YdhS